jgi:four helix bundle protein
VQDHRRLRVWRQAQDLAVAARRATRRFPRSGYGSLQSQITRAAESVVLTIVEGCGAASQREFARFLDIAIKSSRELEAQLELAKDYGVLSGMSCDALIRETVSIRRQLCALRARVIAPHPKPPTQNRTAPNLDSAGPIEGSPVSPTECSPASSAPPPH